MTTSRRFISIVFFVLATVSPERSHAEDISQPEPTPSSKASLYGAAGLSIGNTGDATFAETSYPSLELGVMKGNRSLGLVLGRSNNDFDGEEEFSDYWWELKTAFSFPVGDVSGYALLGLGNYLATKRLFIEYGAGVSCSWDGFSIFGQASNWDGSWYLTPGVMYGF